MSTVTINRPGIERFFERNPLGGGTAVGGITNPQVLARRMVSVAKNNVSGSIVRQRSGTLRESIKPIVRPDPRAGALEVGVGSTAPYSGHLEHGTSKKNYVIRPRPPKRFLVSAPGHPDPLQGRRRSVNHPGIRPKKFLDQAVKTVIRGG